MRFFGKAVKSDWSQQINKERIWCENVGKGWELKRKSDESHRVVINTCQDTYWRCQSVALALFSSANLKRMPCWISATVSVVTTLRISFYIENGDVSAVDPVTLCYYNCPPSTHNKTNCSNNIKKKTHTTNILLLFVIIVEKLSCILNNIYGSVLYVCSF